MTRTISLCLLIAVGGCAIRPPPPPAAIVVCPKLVQHDQKFFDELGNEYVKLAPKSPLRTVVSEWINLRDQTKVCIAKQEPEKKS